MFFLNSNYDEVYLDGSDDKEKDNDEYNPSFKN